MNPETSKKVAQLLVENLPKWRDGTLVLAGLAYVLGYLSWGDLRIQSRVGIGTRAGRAVFRRRCSSRNDRHRLMLCGMVAFMVGPMDSKASFRFWKKGSDHFRAH